MDTDSTQDQQLASNSADAAADATQLAEQFAGIAYFSDMAADHPRRPRSPYRNATASAAGAGHARSVRGRRVPTRPWRLPAGDRSPES